MSSPLGQTRTSNEVFSAQKCTAPVLFNWMIYIMIYLDKLNHGAYQLLKKDAATKIKTKVLNQVKSLKDMITLITKYIIF